MAKFVKGTKNNATVTYATADTQIELQSLVASIVEKRACTSYQNGEWLRSVKISHHIITPLIEFLLNKLKIPDVIKSQRQKTGTHFTLSFTGCVTKWLIPSTSGD